MKNRTVLALSLILIAQIILFFALYLNQQFITQLPKQSLIGQFDIQNTQRIELKANKNTDEDSTEFTLEKKAENWQVKTDSGIVYIDNTKVNNILNTLHTLRPSLGVANSDEAQQRFEVAEDKYQYLLNFNTDKESLSLYLGTSPGYQQTHARVESDSNIYTIQLSNFNLSNNINDWLKPSQLAISSTITSIQAPDFLMQRQSSQTWNVSNITTEQVANQENANKLAEAFKNLWVSELETQSLPANAFRLLVKTEQQRWEFSIAKVKGDYLIQRNDEAIFIFSENQFEKLSLKPFYIKVESSNN